ncbi:MAG: UvrD-helicase domain-containing protein [Clostridia bacterium]|nr:UvrD-helicase domain-containing protein [Clostridia bacterium]
MKNIDEIINGLNEEQIKPVLDTEGAVLVIAGAGSGKTRVLTSRIAYLVAKKGVSPSEILAITFTNKAADEMKKRLTDILGDVGGMWVSTIHSMCVKILRRDIDKIGYDKNFTIYDETDKDKALKRVFEELNISPDKLLKNAKNHISYAKNECLSPDEYKQAHQDLRFIDEIYAVYKRYEETLAHNNCLDFDDLLYKTYILFSTHPEVAYYYSRKFRYVHIDEFQDTNKVQFIIAERLAVANGNIFVVGDDDQSIYGWRGAKIENILNFDRIYRGAKVYKLERNYRSTK